MATIAPPTAASSRDDTQFFLVMAWLMATIIVAGFSFNVATGRSSFGAPLLVHVHAFTMMGWVALYLLQNTLAAGGNLRLHRRLGWLSLAWLPMIAILGVLITRYAVQARGGPPFFDQNQFLVSNPLQLLGLVGLAGWAVAVRRNTGWHRRLMYASVAGLIGPGVGRLVPGPAFIPYTWYVEAILPPILMIAIGIVADMRRTGRAHPAWFWAIGVILALQVVADAFAYSEAGIAFTGDVLAGTPGAARPMEAFVPPA